jgi:signal recognition particle receptor subunit alpha
MQDNEPLMRALAKVRHSPSTPYDTDDQLVTVNNPDKILFVGEALVGNEAVDQLTKFDRALKDFSSAGIGGGARKRGIDGIILTKFDTIVSRLYLIQSSRFICYSIAQSRSND